MMAPHFEQANMLSVCIWRAVEKLGTLIDRIEVESNKVHVWSGSARVTLVAKCADNRGPRGEIVLGAGVWEAEIVES